MLADAIDRNTRQLVCLSDHENRSVANLQAELDALAAHSDSTAQSPDQWQIQQHFISGPQTEQPGPPPSTSREGTGRREGKAHLSVQLKELDRRMNALALRPDAQQPVVQQVECSNCTRLTLELAQARALIRQLEIDNAALRAAAPASQPRSELPPGHSNDSRSGVGLDGPLADMQRARAEMEGELRYW